LLEADPELKARLLEQAKAYRIESSRLIAPWRNLYHQWRRSDWQFRPRPLTRPDGEIHRRCGDRRGRVKQSVCTPLYGV